MEAANLTPVLFVHGAWLSSGSWENWATYFGNRGYPVSAPEWPRKEGDVAKLREDADAIEGLGLPPRSSTTTNKRSTRSTSRPF